MSTIGTLDNGWDTLRAYQIPDLPLKPRNPIKILATVPTPMEATNESASKRALGGDTLFSALKLNANDLTTDCLTDAVP
jgi:hypothetical protein